jgi:hypothetical protein
MDPSYPFVAEVRTANISLMYKLLIPGTLHHDTRGNSRPPISKVGLLDVQIGMVAVL